MANTHSTLTGLFTDIADAIRTKTGGTDSIVADNFPEAIGEIVPQEDLDTELTTQDDLIAQIAVALEGKAGASGGASSVTVGEATQATSDTSITITDLIGKDNVALMFMDTSSCPASQMEDAGLINVIIQGTSHYYNIHYYDGSIAYSNDGFIVYDKATGHISLSGAYNERFVAGKYMYIVW